MNVKGCFGELNRLPGSCDNYSSVADIFWNRELRINQELNVKIISGTTDRSEPGYKKVVNYLGELVGVDYFYDWIPATPVFLNAATGSGKTYFLKHDVLTRLLKYNKSVKSDSKKRILIITNRTALEEQYKKDIAKIVDEYEGDGAVWQKWIKERESAPVAIDGLKSIGPVDFITMQGYLKHDEFRKDIYSMVFWDECHAVTEESTFNYNTDSVLDAILHDHICSIFVFASATLNECFRPIMRAFRQRNNDAEIMIRDDLKRKEYSETAIIIASINGQKMIPMNDIILQRKFRNLMLPMAFEFDNVMPDKIPYCRRLFLKQLSNEKELQYRPKSWKKPIYEAEIPRPYAALIYTLDKNYQYISFTEQFEATGGGPNEGLIEILKKTSGKAIVFVDSIKKGQELKEQLAKTCNISASLVQAKGKYKSNTYQQIVSDETLSCNILISTSVLDNGINIKDEKVTAIVIMKARKTAFIQMLGRLRGWEGQDIKFYFPKLRSGDLNKFLKRDVYNLVDRVKFEMMADDKERRRFYDNFTEQYQCQMLKGTCLQEEDGRVVTNTLAREYLASNIIFLKKMLHQMGVEKISYNDEGNVSNIRRLQVIHELEEKTEKSSLFEPYEKTLILNALDESTGVRMHSGLKSYYPPEQKKKAFDDLNIALLDPSKIDLDFDEIMLLVEYMGRLNHTYELLHSEFDSEKICREKEKLKEIADLFNRIYLKEVSDPDDIMFAERLSWIGKRFKVSTASLPPQAGCELAELEHERIRDNETGIEIGSGMASEREQDSHISNDTELINFLELHAVKDEGELRLLEQTEVAKDDYSEYDSLAVKKGMLKDSQRCHGMIRYITSQSKSGKTCTSINNYLKGKKIGYELFSIELKEGTDGYPRKKTFWMVKKITGSRL